MKDKRLIQTAGLAWSIVYTYSMQVDPSETRWKNVNSVNIRKYAYRNIDKDKLYEAILKSSDTSLMKNKNSLEVSLNDLNKMKRILLSLKK